VQLGKRLRHIEGDLDKLDAQMLEPTRKDQNMAKRMEHLIGIAALGHVSMRCGQREKDSIAAVMHKQLVPANTLLRDIQNGQKNQLRRTLFLQDAILTFKHDHPMGAF
jgi:hypothetical protein